MADIDTKYPRVLWKPSGLDNPKRKKLKCFQPSRLQWYILMSINRLKICNHSLEISEWTNITFRFITFLPAPCSPPIPPANGFVFGDNHQHQSLVQFWCDQGYTLEGPPSRECIDGKWDKKAPYCKGNLHYTWCQYQSKRDHRYF